MERYARMTADGSATVYIPGMNVTYHSRHGAVQESRHVFINAGLDYYRQHYAPAAPVSVFEMGFGTGLNALLSWQYTADRNLRLRYEAVEWFPLTAAEVMLLDYSGFVPGGNGIFTQLHSAPWGVETGIDASFSLCKINTSLLSHTPAPCHIIYYDAFAPGAQPELWTEAVFRKLYDALSVPGLLVTYCSKSDVRRALQAVGFSVAKIPGPPGKREMLRAIKA